MILATLVRGRGNDVANPPVDQPLVVDVPVPEDVGDEAIIVLESDRSLFGFENELFPQSVVVVRYHDDVLVGIHVGQVVLEPAVVLLGGVGGFSVADVHRQDDEVSVPRLKAVPHRSEILLVEVFRHGDFLHQVVVAHRVVHRHAHRSGGHAVAVKTDTGFVADVARMQDEIQVLVAGIVLERLHPTPGFGGFVVGDLGKTDHFALFSGLEGKIVTLCASGRNPRVQGEIPRRNGHEDETRVVVSRQGKRSVFIRSGYVYPVRYFYPGDGPVAPGESPVAVRIAVHAPGVRLGKGRTPRQRENRNQKVSEHGLISYWFLSRRGSAIRATDGIPRP